MKQEFEEYRVNTNKTLAVLKTKATRANISTKHSSKERDYLQTQIDLDVKDLNKIKDSYKTLIKHDKKSVKHSQNLKSKPTTINSLNLNTNNLHNSNNLNDSNSFSRSINKSLYTKDNTYNNNNYQDNLNSNASSGIPLQHSLQQVRPNSA